MTFHDRTASLIDHVVEHESRLDANFKTAGPLGVSRLYYTVHDFVTELHVHMVHVHIVYCWFKAMQNIFFVPDCTWYFSRHSRFRANEWKIPVHLASIQRHPLSFLNSTVCIRY